MNAVMENLTTILLYNVVAKNTILLKLTINLTKHIRCVARMEMKCAHKNGPGLGAAARPPVDQGQNPGWGQVYFY